MAASGVTTRDFDGEQAYVLRDGDAEAWIVPSIGANCIAFIKQIGTRTAYLLSTPASAEALRGRPTFWGFPILSPYPGRHQTPFTWRNQLYAIAPNDRPGVAIHGIVAGSPWQVLDASPTRLTCLFDSETFPSRAERWPWPFRLTATHRIEDGALTLDLELENRSGAEIPHLLGLHPYFPVRLAPPAPLPAAARPPAAAQVAGEGGAAARGTCRVWVAADELWEMKAGLGTGEIRRLDGAWDLRRPRSVAELERDLAQPPGPGPFGDDRAARGPRLPVLLYGKRAALRVPEAGTDPREAGGILGGVRDDASGVELTLESSAGFGSLAVFCPPEQPFISLEPRSAVSDALTLMNDPRGLATGIYPLGPGQRWAAWTKLSAGPIVE